MTPRQRVGRLALVTALLVATAAGLAHASVAEKKPKAQNPCKLLKLAEIEVQFGGSVTIGKGGEHDNPNSKDDCPYEVAPNDLTPQGGTLYVITVFPAHDLGTSGKDAIEAVTNQQTLEGEQFSFTIVDVPDVGAAAYLNDENRQITFAKNKKRAYSLQWVDNDISGFGLPTPQPIIDRLKALAADIIG